MLQFLDRPGFLLVALIAILLFGAKRLPDSARSLGRSMRILKAETKGLRDPQADDDLVVTPVLAPVTAPVVQVPAPAGVPGPVPAAVPTHQS